MKKIIFCGIFILVCCLFGEIGAVDGKTDISGKCIEMTIPSGNTITLNDVCLAAGHGPCLEANPGAFQAFTDGDCSNGGWAGNVTCNTPMTFIGVDYESVQINGLICDMRTWGMIPQPENVPGDFNQSIKNATDWILGFVGMIAVLMLIWGGINYLTSAGDEDKARTGKKTISYALIGLVVAGIAYAIVDVIITVIL